VIFAGLSIVTYVVALWYSHADLSLERPRELNEQSRNNEISDEAYELMLEATYLPKDQRAI